MSFFPVCKGAERSSGDFIRRAAQQRCIAMLRARPPNSHAHHGGITDTCFTERGGQAYSHSQRHLKRYVLVIYYLLPDALMYYLIRCFHTTMCGV